MKYNNSDDVIPWTLQHRAYVSHRVKQNHILNFYLLC